MKIGITLPEYYKEYIEEIAKVNNLSKTAVCGLILENFLSFNKERRYFPRFKRQTTLVFEKPKNSGEKPDEPENDEQTATREEILARLANKEDE